MAHYRLKSVSSGSSSSPTGFPEGAKLTVRLAEALLVLGFLLTDGERGKTIDMGEVVVFDTQLRTLLSRDATLERLLSGFGLLEGPVWEPDGAILFSDMRAHRVYRWSPGEQLSLYPVQVPYSQQVAGDWTPSGPNGLAIDPHGHITICEHGNRRVSRVERNGLVTVLAEFFEGRRLNSPNDLVYRSDGLLYFTDPPAGLQYGNEDPQKELPFSGVYLLSQDRLRLVSVDLTRPNGVALSPDEHYLYVGSSGGEGVVMRYLVHEDGLLSKGEVFVRASAFGNPAWFDGIKVDVQGNLYVASSLGVIIVSPAGTHLGTIILPEAPTNLAWGEEDAKSLYITGSTSLYRMRTKVQGSRLSILPDS
jgi:gluconolactonase